MLVVPCYCDFGSLERSMGQKVLQPLTESQSVLILLNCGEEHQQFTTTRVTMGVCVCVMGGLSLQYFGVPGFKCLWLPASSHS